MPRASALKSVPGVPSNDQIINAATGRWGEVANEIKLAEPYVIDKVEGGQIVIAPLTRRRRKALKAAQAAYLMLGAQMVQVQQDQNADQGTMDRLNSLLEEADSQYNAALFGDAHQEIEDYFENLPEEFWDKMYEDVHNRLVNRVEAPEDVCSKCGQRVGGEEGEEGKGASSSTSSTATGTK